MTMRIWRLVLGAITMLAVGLGQSREAAAQGCVLIRDTAPVIGSASSTYLRPGEWQLDFSFRDSTADRHYSLDVFQAQRTALGTYVVNKQKLTVANVQYGVTSRLSVGVAVPVVMASWSIPSPIAPTPGPRATQNGRGFGDISATGRLWLFDTQNQSRRNVSVGVGLKLPTGSASQTDTFVDLTGLNASAKAVDQSVQPGDGGVAAQFEVQGFHRVKRAVIFGSASYLLNPRNTNGTPSILVGIGRPSATNPLRNVNSVPDQYILRTGVGVPLGHGLGLSVAWRGEGVPRYDLVGRSDGFRRPGHEYFIEPGISFTQGRNTVQFTMPRAYARFRAPDPYTGANGDATFPDWVAIGSYSYRFGQPKHVAMRE